MTNLQEVEANLIDLLASVSPGTVSAQVSLSLCHLSAKPAKSLALSDREAGPQS
jgi:hypothetical protein